MSVTSSDSSDDSLLNDALMTAEFSSYNKTQEMENKLINYNGGGDFNQNQKFNTFSNQIENSDNFKGNYDKNETQLSYFEKKELQEENEKLKKEIKYEIQIENQNLKQEVLSEKEKSGYLNEKSIQQGCQVIILKTELQRVIEKFDAYKQIQEKQQVKQNPQKLNPTDLNKDLEHQKEQKEKIELEIQIQLQNVQIKQLQQKILEQNERFEFDQKNMRLIFSQSEVENKKVYEEQYQNIKEKLEEQFEIQTQEIEFLKKELSQKEQNNDIVQKTQEIQNKNAVLQKEVYSVKSQYKELKQDYNKLINDYELLLKNQNSTSNQNKIKNEIKRLEEKQRETEEITVKGIKLQIKDLKNQLDNSNFQKKQALQKLLLLSLENVRLREILQNISQEIEAFKNQSQFSKSQVEILNEKMEVLEKENSLFQFQSQQIREENVQLLEKLNILEKKDNLEKQYRDDYLLFYKQNQELKSQVQVQKQLVENLNINIQNLNQKSEDNLKYYQEQIEQTKNEYQQIVENTILRFNENLNKTINSQNESPQKDDINVQQIEGKNIGFLAKIIQKKDDDIKKLKLLLKEKEEVSNIQFVQNINQKVNQDLKSFQNNEDHKDQQLQNCEQKDKFWMKNGIFYKGKELQIQRLKTITQIEQNQVQQENEQQQNKKGNEIQKENFNKQLTFNDSIKNNSENDFQIQQDQIEGLNRKVESRYGFAQSSDLFGPIHERPLADRVVTTSSWPVPYYQRIFKAYPVREQKDKQSLLLSDIDIDDTNWYQAKQFLKQTYKGREVVNHVENHSQTNTYIMIQNDVASMAKAYVADFSQFIDVANKENKRILNKTNLI
ncbi:hypothetical protein PPERSA_01888 [Pseudocohnilembus persalinus]|uniref:Uncharacterized protein n=1 Tax=Pseudocohnilembus persalinus TaxID=266149 RepID=A0A0V0R3C2_PSEPJ|nr:hypothetical protein PPERSA_01888 [Pseudocohnilembus persalinus]|eukprot:KRX09001.1 hypothetical protein PPERSA_01888 [Pseudocohnilembus persalinus]